MAGEPSLVVDDGVDQLAGRQLGLGGIEEANELLMAMAEMLPHLQVAIAPNLIYESSVAGRSGGQFHYLPTGPSRGRSCSNKYRPQEDQLM
jgi:hypothetical protein